MRTNDDGSGRGGEHGIDFFFLAQGLVGAVLLGSFQACAIYIPAAPDVQGNRAKSKPLAP